MSEQGLPFDSPYQSFEYMAEMRKYFGEKIAQEIEALQTWRDETGAVVVFKEHALRVARGERA